MLLRYPIKIKDEHSNFTMLTSEGFEDVLCRTSDLRAIMVCVYGQTFVVK